MFMKTHAKIVQNRETRKFCTNYVSAFLQIYLHNPNKSIIFAADLWLTPFFRSDARGSKILGLKLFEETFSYS